MTDAEEKAYVEGQRVAWRAMLHETLVKLGRDSAEYNEKAWLLEREEAISMLRGICAAHGDNDWPDELSLADIIEKHLGDYLSE